MDRLIRNVLISIFVGLALLTLTSIVTGGLNPGFPVSYTYWALGCAAPGFACISINPVLLELDYIFWIGIALVFFVGFDFAWAKNR